MLLEYFGLRCDPFGVTPDPRFLYENHGHREALASLEYGIAADRGFLALIAEPGLGKTTVLFRLVEQFRPTARIAFLFQTQCTSREFLGYLLADLEIDATEDIVTAHQRLNEVLAEEARNGRRCIVVIDEAQNLDPSVMETVRLLSDFESPQRKLLHIVMAGQPELAHKLAEPELKQLRQRISMISWLAPLQSNEIEDYISHRVTTAGYRGPSLFSTAAISLIADASAGIPRQINNLCFNSLLLCCALDKRQVDRQMVEEVVSDLDLRKTVEPLDPNRGLSLANLSTNSLQAHDGPALVAIDGGLHDNIDEVAASFALPDHPGPRPSTLLNSASQQQRPHPAAWNEVQFKSGAMAVTETQTPPQPRTPPASSRRVGATKEPTAAPLPFRQPRKGNQPPSSSHRREWMSPQLILAAALVAGVLMGVAAIMRVKSLHTSAAPSPTPITVRDKATPRASSEQSDTALQLKSDGSSDSASKGNPPTQGVVTINRQTQASTPTPQPARSRPSSEPRYSGATHTTIENSTPDNTAVLRLPAGGSAHGDESTGTAPPPPEVASAELSGLSVPPPAIPRLELPATQSINPAVLQMVQPTYPPLAKLRGIEGAVKLRADVGEDGRVERVNVLSGNPVLASAAAGAVRLWRYKPLSISGTPSGFQTIVMITFTLSRNAASTH